MRQTPIIELDVHGMTAEEAIARIEKEIAAANQSTYRVRVIHGFNRGTSIQKAIYRELGFGLNPKVKRILGGENCSENPGITEIVLKEY